jgi:hypothetical protein
MPTDSNPAARAEAVPTGRLWFGSAAATGAWFGLGLSDMFITWRACLHEEQFGGPSAHPGSRILFFLFTFLLFALAAVAGIMSYRNWKRLSGLTVLLRAEATERKEFMALAGLFISFTLGVGIVWLCLPLFIIQMCIRAR